MYRIARYTTSPIRTFVSYGESKSISRASGKQVQQQQIHSDEHRLNELFEEVVRLPELDRQAFLNKHCAGMPEMKGRIEILLKGADQTPPDHFLDPSNVMQLFKRLSAMDNSR